MVTPMIDAAVEAAVAPLASALSAFIFYPIPLAGFAVPWIVLWLAVAARFFAERGWLFGIGIALLVPIPARRGGPAVCVFYLRVLELLRPQGLHLSTW
jgi:hypothetical protein